MRFTPSGSSFVVSAGVVIHGSQWRADEVMPVKTQTQWRVLGIAAQAVRGMLGPCLLVCGGWLSFVPLVRAEQIRVAAAADLKFAMDEIVASFEKANPGDDVEVIYGSSGKFYAQIQQGAPFDLYFSADCEFPRGLAKAGFSASAVTPYAFGRIVLWSTSMDASRMTLAGLTDPRITRIAIANPKHAPYGKRAEEALRALGLLEKIKPKLVYGENVSQTAEFVRTGNAQIGIIALSLALSPELAMRGGYWLIPQRLHAPMEQCFIVTEHGKNSGLARRFARYMLSASVRALMRRYGFVLPDERIGG